MDAAARTGARRRVQPPIVVPRGHALRRRHHPFLPLPPFWLSISVPRGHALRRRPCVCSCVLAVSLIGPLFVNVGRGTLTCTWKPGKAAAGPLADAAVPAAEGWQDLAFAWEGRLFTASLDRRADPDRRAPRDAPHIGGCAWPGHRLPAGREVHPDR